MSLRSLCFQFVAVTDPFLFDSLPLLCRCSIDPKIDHKKVGLTPFQHALENPKKPYWSKITSLQSCRSSTLAAANPLALECLKLLHSYPKSSMWSVHGEKIAWSTLLQNHSSWIVVGRVLPSFKVLILCSAAAELLPLLTALTSCPLLQIQRTLAAANPLALEWL